MWVGIDSAHKKSFTGIISGSEKDIHQLYSDIEKVMKSEGINPPFHWTSIKSSRRESVVKSFKKNVNFSRVGFTILVHKNKTSMPSLFLFHEIVPKTIAESISNWSKRINGKILFEVNGDFDIGNSKTKHFVHKMISYLISFLTDDKLIKIFDKHGVFLAEFNQGVGKLMLVAYPCSAKNSKAIQIVDLLLGAFVYRAKFKYKNFQLKNIC
jgi:hypothetical protein